MNSTHHELSFELLYVSWHLHLQIFEIFFMSGTAQSRTPLTQQSARSIARVCGIERSPTRNTCESDRIGSSRSSAPNATVAKNAVIIQIHPLNVTCVRCGECAGVCLRQCGHALPRTLNAA